MFDARCYNSIFRWFQTNFANDSQGNKGEGTESVLEVYFMETYRVKAFYKEENTLHEDHLSEQFAHSILQIVDGRLDIDHESDSNP